MRLLSGLRVVIAVIVLLALGHVVVHLVAGPGDRLYAFIYQRGPVQYLILVVGASALVLLYSRRRQYHRSAARLKAFERGRGNPPEPLAEALRKVGRCCADYGAGAAWSRVERFHDEQSNAVQKNHDLIHFFVGSLPVLGLLGTMLGLSDALYAAFSQGFGAESVEQFVVGLSTALDTTVLAMVCAAPLFACTTLQVRQQSHLVDRYAECLRERSGLADVPERDKATYVIYAELCRVTKQIGEDAKSMFADVLANSVAALRDVLSEAVQDQSERIAEQLPQTVSRGMADAMAHATRLLDQRHASLAERMTRQMGRLETTLRNRTPEEVIIRYRENGAAHRGA